MGIEIDLTSALGSKLTWFCVGDKSCLGFSARTVFCAGVRIDLFLYAGRDLLVFSVSMEIDLVLVMVVQIDLISVWGIELDLISV